MKTNALLVIKGIKKHINNKIERFYIKNYFHCSLFVKCAYMVDVQLCNTNNYLLVSVL